MAELELPGMLVDGSYAPPPPVPPTLSPAVSTSSPTPEPTIGAETFEPTLSTPTIPQTSAPITSSGSVFVASVLDPTKPSATFGCDPGYAAEFILDGTTYKWMWYVLFLSFLFTP